MQILPSALLSISSYLIAMLLLRKCRPTFRPLVSPVNWFLLLFFLELVATPIVILITGVSNEFVPVAASDFATNFALVMYTVGFWAFCVSIQIHRRKQAVLATCTFSKPEETWFPPLWLIFLYSIMGVVGVGFFFKSPARLIMYFISPQLFISDAQSGGSTSLADAASLFLRTFLPFSIIMLWSRGVARSKARKGLFSALRSPALIFLVAITAPLYSYERASLVIPMVAVSAVMLKTKGRASLLKVGAVLLVVVFFVAIITSYRADPAAAAGGYNGPTRVDFFQLYGMAPQYLGLFLEKLRYGNPPHWGATVLASFLDPTPILGKPFRTISGSALFAAVSARPEIPAPFIGEIFLDFNVFGIVGGFYLLGFFVAKLQNKFDLASEPLHIYILQLVSVWVSYLVTLGVEEVSIAVVYLLWPTYTFLAYRRAKRFIKGSGYAELPSSSLRNDQPGRAVI